MTLEESKAGDGGSLGSPSVNTAITTAASGGGLTKADKKKRKMNNVLAGSKRADWRRGRLLCLLCLLHEVCVLFFPAKDSRYGYPVSHRN